MDAARSREHGGSGLGLAICKSIVESFGGKIGASNSPAAGLKVSMVFPRHHGRGFDARQSCVNQRRCGMSRDILVVEDEIKITEILKDYLVSAGYGCRVSTAEIWFCPM